MNDPSRGVAAIIPAFDEAERIEATVRAVSSIPSVEAVIVVDDASKDETGARAQAAGATVIRNARNRGKAASLVAGARAAAPGALLLFLDADLGETARYAAALVEPVAKGHADATIALLPPPPGSVGGHGFVVKLARRGILRATGWTATQPLSGQRCLTRAAFEAALPLASRFGVETAMTIDLLRARMRILEVEVPFAHRWSGTSWRDQLHRARQFADVALALAGRRSAT